jgi:oligoendopeptidase F
MTMKIIAFWLMLAAAPALAASGGAFDPLPGAQKDLYRFDLKKMYAGEADWQADMEKVRGMAGRIEAYRGKLLGSAANLLAVMDLHRDANDVLVKLYAYGEFRQAVNTDDRVAYEAYERLLADYGSRTSFVDVELKGLSAATLVSYLKAEPGLVPYRFLLEDAVRMGPHTLPEAQESLLAKLAPDLTSWQPALFQKVFDRTPFPKVVAGGKEYECYRDFDALMQNPDRAAREKAFKGTYETFEAISDLVAFSLLQEMRTYNEQAKLRGFDSYYGEQLFRRYLSRPQVDNLFGQIEMRQPIYGSYQTWRAAQVQADHAIAKAAIWDMEMPLKGAEPPRYTADEGAQLVRDSLAVLGTEYARELGLLLDPKNGRMDIAGGPKRSQGAFCEGYFGYFMDNYQGLLDNVATMAHESGHAIHHRLVTNKRGSLLLSEGPAYMTESFAMFNEWLVRDRLFKTEKDPARLRALKVAALNDEMYLWEIARRAKFEMVAYDRVAKGEISDEKGFNKACEDTGKLYDAFFATTPELEVHWIRKHHYWSVPTYYVNYVVAHVLALTYYQRYLADPQGFPKKYEAMVANGFDRPAAALLQDFLGISLDDPNLLEGVFKMIAKDYQEISGGQAPRN